MLRIIKVTGKDGDIIILEIEFDHNINNKLNLLIKNYGESWF
jgi:hypothetical protein